MISESTNATNEKVLYPRLSYQLTGILYKTHNELGRYCNEQQYGDRIERLLKEQGILYEREKALPPSFVGEAPGRNKVDFLIENCVVLELKAKRLLLSEDYYQVKRYLVACNKELALLANFRQRHLIPKRILNSEYSGHSDTFVD